jgi:hypothetical protein
MKCMQRDTYGKKMGSIVMGCGVICQSEVKGVPKEGGSRRS